MTTPDIPTEALEVAARALYNLGKTSGIDWWAGSVTEDTRALFRTKVHAVLAAAAPHLIAEGRRQAAAELRAYANNYPEDVFSGSSDSRDAIAGTAMRHAYRNAAVIVTEGGDHG